MSAGKPPVGLAAIGYLIYRRATKNSRGSSANPARVWLVRLLLVMFVMPVAGPILWHAFLHMPFALSFFLVSATVLRIVRWYWRRP